MLSAPENCSALLGILGESCYLDIRHLLDAAFLDTSFINAANKGRTGSGSQSCL